MASVLNMGLFHTVPAKKQVITTTMSRPASSPDYLITWGILHLNDKAPEKLWEEEVERRFEKVNFVGNYPGSLIIQLQPLLGCQGNLY